MDFYYGKDRQKGIAFCKYKLKKERYTYVYIQRYFYLIGTVI